MAELLKIARDQFIQKGYRTATMNGIAAAAGLSKPTLYAWHADKASLFRACLMDEAERFPAPDINACDDLLSTLEQYACDLLQEFSSREVYDVGLSYLRDRDDFPEISEHVSRVNDIYVVQPLAAYLERLGVAANAADEQARFFIMIALAPLHRSLIFGTVAPDADFAKQYSRKAVTCFMAVYPMHEVNHAEVARPA